MATGQEAASRTGAGRERRSHLRYPVDGDATLLLLNRNQPLRCHIVDLSLQGCCIRSTDRLAVAQGTSIEVHFKIHGVNFRFGGVIRWTDRNRAGIQFSQQIRRQTEDLRAVLAEIEAGVRRPAPQEQLPQQPQAAPAPASTPSGSSSPPKPGPSGQERRAQSRQAVDTAAAILVVRSGSRCDGRILDLSLGGCRIRTLERFPLGIYTRVEVEFRLEGLPFRLGGVIQAIHGQHTVGIRFLDMSARKQSGVVELIAEIHAFQEAHPEAGGDPPSALPQSLPSP